MEISLKDPERIFLVGKDNNIQIKHAADITLLANEQITFLSSDNREYDIVKKEWGYYASPSINGRLKSFGFRSFLVSNNQNKLYLMCVDSDMMNEFRSYCKDEGQKVVLELTDWNLVSDELGQLLPAKK